MLLTDLTSAPDDKSNIAKKWEKVSPIPISILHTKTITDTCANTQKVLTIQQYLYIDINNPSLQWCYAVLSSLSSASEFTYTIYGTYGILLYYATL